MRRSLSIVLAFWLSVLAMLPACDSSVDIFTDSGQYYSLFGFLDATADTQWVRVKVLQDSMLTEAGPMDAVMTMTTLSTGNSVSWRDSIFSVIGGALVHNFWVAEPLARLESYRLEVRRSDGATSSTTVTLPDTFATPVFSDPPLTQLPFGTGCITNFRMDAHIPSLATADVTYYIPSTAGNEIAFTVDYSDEAVFYEEGFWRVNFKWMDDVKFLMASNPYVDITSLTRLRAVEVRVAAAGPNWPDYTLDDETLAIPGVASYVENGLGFVGGVVSRRIDLSLGTYRSARCFQ